MNQFLLDDDPEQIYKAPDAPFYYWQMGFWGFLCIVSFFTLTLWYNHPSWAYIAPILTQSIVGLLCSLVVERVIVAVWDKALFIKSLISFAIVVAISSLWTVIRMLIFEYMTGEQHIWEDFGGWYFSSIFIFISWAALYYGVQYYELLQQEHRSMLRAEAEARDQQNKRMHAQANARDAQMKMLRYQLNPHFLCNTLNAINALIECDETEKAQEMSVKLSQFFRHSLDNIPNTKITLESEINALNLYLQIEKIRFEDRLSLDFNIDADANAALVPSLLLQPIIENSMKHAIAKCETGGTITLRAEVIDEHLYICMQDSGPGIKVGKSKLQSVIGRGVGLKNTDDRLKTLYDDRFQFNITSIDGGGLRTEITIPYETNAQELSKETA